MKISSPGLLLWIGTAGVLGFAISAIFSGWLQWDRSTFVLLYGVLVAAFSWAYFRLQRIDPLVQLRRRWRSGTVFGILLGLFLWQGVLSQPESAQPEGAGLYAALAWFGVVYGLADAVLLNVVPVLGVFAMAREKPMTPVRRLRWGVAALAASLLVTAFYHAGFAEFRGPALIQPLVGNGIITAGYLLTGSPLTALVAHPLMHIAAVLHGMETTAQLPPHY